MKANKMELIIMLNRVCNLNCKFCFQNANNFKDGSSCGEKEMDVLISFIRSRKQINRITLMGGEAFLDHVNLRTILDVITSENLTRPNTNKISVVLTTNGTIYLPWIKDYLKIIDSMQISIDGGPTSHNINRKYIDDTGSYDIAICNTRKYVNDGVNVSIRGVVTWSSFRQWYKSVKQLFNDVPKSCGISFDFDHVYESNQFKILLGKLVILSVLAKAKKKYGFRKPYLVRYGRFPGNHATGCGQLRNAIAVDAVSGNICTCLEKIGSPKYVIGNISDIDNPIKNAELVIDCEKSENYRNFKIQFIPTKLSSFLLSFLGMHSCVHENIHLTGKWNVIPFYKFILYIITSLNWYRIYDKRGNRNESTTQIH